MYMYVYVYVHVHVYVCVYVCMYMYVCLFDPRPATDERDARRVVHTFKSWGNISLLCFRSVGLVPGGIKYFGILGIEGGSGSHIHRLSVKYGGRKFVRRSSLESILQ